MYKLDPTLAAGPIFNFQYDGRLFFNTYHNEADMCLQNTQTLDLIVYIEIQDTLDQYIAAKVIGISAHGSDIYTLQHLQANSIVNMPKIGY